MDKLEFQNILEGLREGKYEPSYIIELMENNKLNHLYSDEIEEIVLSFEKDEDKISMLKHTIAPIKIIKTLKSEDSIIEAIGKLSEKVQKSTKVLNLKLSLSREGFRKVFFREEDKKYDIIGLDKDITIGMELETLGANSESILESGEKNGKIIHKEKEIECGKIVKRRRQRR